MNDDEGNPARRKLLAASACTLGGLGIGAVGTALIGSLRPTEATLEAGREKFRRIVNISDLKPGEPREIEVGGRPLMLLRRTPEDLKMLERFEEDLADPTSNEYQQPTYAKNRYRSRDPELLVVDLVCTHLGCQVAYIPPGRADFNLGGNPARAGFNCPCHSAAFDLAGRVLNGMPAPVNLRVPKYKLLGSNEVQLGYDKDDL